MIGNGILAFAVIAVVVIFIYMSLKLQNDRKKGRQYSEIYNIELTSGFTGDSISVFMNDSLLLNTRIQKDSIIKLNINRFAEESALLIVDNKTEKVSTFSLSEKGGKIIISKNNSMIYLLGAD